MANKQKGYTIIEVMLFLGISGVLFSMTVFGMGGQQNNLRFQQSMEDIEFRIRDMLSNTDKGYEAKPDADGNPNTEETYNCSGATPTASTTVGCVFVGREINLCGATMYVESRLAPYTRANYTDTNAILALAPTNTAARETFSAPGGVQYVSASSSPAGACRIAALNNVIGISNQRVPRYNAVSGGDNWVAVRDDLPTKLCFREQNNSNKLAQITITQSNVALEVGKCD